MLIHVASRKCSCGGSLCVGASAHESSGILFREAQHLGRDHVENECSADTGALNDNVEDSSAGCRIRGCVNLSAGNCLRSRHQTCRINVNQTTSQACHVTR